MTMHHDQLRATDFAEQCVRALFRIKHAMPDTWRSVLLPYQEKIKATAEMHSESTTSAVLRLLNAVNQSARLEEQVRMEHYYFLAAYYAML